MSDELPLTHFDQKQFDKAIFNITDQPSIKSIQAQLRKKNKELSLAEKDRYPSFNAFARYNNLWMNNEQQWVVGVGFNLPFDFGKRTSREGKIKAERLALGWQQQDITSELRETLTQSYSHWREAKEVLQLYHSELLPLAEENMNTARDEYRSGSGDFLSFLTAQRQLLSTERKADQALRDQFAYYSQLLAAAGLVYPVANSQFGENNEFQNIKQEKNYE
ncbi:TolC family protein [Alteromonas sp. MB-3u-76]|uniref:TolC family protein n=1 Tax=Alteromonas sp. MB-3u-76 TaxID=2058133 RepID=UPI0012FD218F|nr:TolC family protein [Alteromonas sp. MB-3u-76]